MRARCAAAALALFVLALSVPADTAAEPRCRWEGSVWVCDGRDGQDGQDGKDADPAVTDRLRRDLDANGRHDGRQDTRLDAHEAAIGRHAGAIGRHETVIRQHGAALAGHGARLDDHAGRLDFHQAELARVRERLGAHDRRLDRADAGIVAAMAMAQIPYAPRHRFSYGVGWSSFDGQAGLAVGAQLRLQDRVWLRGSVSRVGQWTAVAGGVGSGW